MVGSGTFDGFSTEESECNFIEEFSTLEIEVLNGLSWWKIGVNLKLIPMKKSAREIEKFKS